MYNITTTGPDPQRGGAGGRGRRRGGLRRRGGGGRVPPDWRLGGQDHAARGHEARPAVAGGCGGGFDLMEGFLVAPP